MTLNETLKRVNKALKAPLNQLEIDKAMILLHHRLTETKWAIKDEKLRGECEKLLIQMTVARYMADRIPVGERQG